MGVDISSAKPPVVVPSREVLPKAVPSIAVIDLAIDSIFPKLSKCQHNRIRTYALRCFTEMTGTEIAATTDQSPSAVTHIWNKIRKEISNDTDLKQQMDALARCVKYLVLKFQ
jgi:hypothetical protein